VLPECLKDNEYRTYEKRFKKAVEDKVAISKGASRLLKDLISAA